MDEKELLSKCGIEESLWDKCFVKDGLVYTPVLDCNGNIVKTGRERYENKFINKDIKKYTFANKVKDLFKGGRK